MVFAIVYSSVGSRGTLSRTMDKQLEAVAFFNGQNAKKRKKQEEKNQEQKNRKKKMKKKKDKEEANGEEEE